MLTDLTQEPFLCSLHSTAHTCVSYEYGVVLLLQFNDKLYSNRDRLYARSDVQKQ